MFSGLSSKEKFLQVYTRILNGDNKDERNTMR